MRRESIGGGAPDLWGAFSLGRVGGGAYARLTSSYRLARYLARVLGQTPRVGLRPLGCAVAAGECRVFMGRGIRASTQADAPREGGL